MTKNSIFSRSLRDSTALRALTLLGAGAVASAMYATPALAQASTATPTPATTATPDQAAAQADKSNDIIITGSISRNPAAATASPVVTTTAADLQNRGVTTVADALQLLTANNAGTAPPSWSSFGFATGASAPSLRGLNDAYTLTLFNGMRTAFYPLGDDGYRNFVDINTIPISIVDHIDTLLDGASATYGSDAIAGVINVIVKRQITGLHLNGSASITQRGDAGERRLSATAGYGDLDRQGFNVYINGEYQKSDPLLVRDRGYPFNTADLSMICGTAAQGCLGNGIRNALQPDGSYLGFSSTAVPFVREYTPGGAAVGAQYQLLNPALGCQNLTGHTFTAAERAASAAAGFPIASSTPNTVCQEDLVNEYRAYNSDITRKGLNARATVKLGSFGEGYVMANYYNTTTRGNNAGPQGFTGSTTTGGQIVTVSAILLPAYVCSAGVGAVTATALSTTTLTASGCNAANGTLNPNNPFAASGDSARLLALPQQSRSTNTDTKTYRISGGIDGSFGDGWHFNLAGTASEVVLRTQNTGYIYLQGLLDAIAKGTYNFVDPSQNTQSNIDGVFKPNNNKSTSKLTQIQATLDKDLFNLPGGALTVAVTGQFRYEAIHNPSSNPANPANPNARYFGVNAVGVDGKRHVWSAGYEITAPIFSMLKLKAEGSYDSYSTGQSRFSPKFEAEFKPIEQIKLRGTYGKGFRIPSFSESFALPTTGFVSASIVCTNPIYTAFCAAHASNPSYYGNGAPYSYGLTSSGNPNLKPETSTSLTGGIVLQPVRRVTITVDYWSTKIKNVIVGATAPSDLFAQYYGNNGVVNSPGITVTQAVADPQNLNALPLLGTVVGSYTNADSFLAKGVDFSASAKFDIISGVQWQSNFNASLLLRLQQGVKNLATGAVTIQRYDNSLGQCNITSCSGAPKWRFSWQNTLKFGDTASVSLTGYYTSGFSEVAADQPGAVYGDCATTTGQGDIASYPNGDPIMCRSKSIFDLDGHVEFYVGKKFTFYADVQNIMNRQPPLDFTAAYGLYSFNPAWADRLFIGRSFRFGAKVDF